jgi:hypothetical protein
MQYLSDAINWEFLDEPAYRWFIFLGALSLMFYIWGVVLSFMK